MQGKKGRIHQQAEMSLRKDLKLLMPWSSKFNLLLINNKIATCCLTENRMEFPHNRAPNNMLVILMSEECKLNYMKQVVKQ